MCGISGIFSSQAVNHREPVIQSMMSCMVHRGPDAAGIHVDKGMIFGFRRLSIIDLKFGNQPMRSEDGRYTLIFNGEIYNYIELRQKLTQQGVQFRTFSDTEILLQVLINHGVDGLKLLNGMFALAFFDHETQEWILARDPFGIKPLYYAQVDDELVFASEIKALFAHPQIRPEVYQPALQEYLTFQFCLNSHTLFSRIHKVSPGYCLIGSGNKIYRQIEYWDINYTIDEYHTEEYYIDRLRSLIEESIHIQTRSDVPLGTYLSGGIDSSLVTSIAADYLGNTTKAFHGFFSEGSQYDESQYAREVAKSNQIDLKAIMPTAQQFVEDMPYIIYMLDEPVAGPGIFPQYRVSRFAKEHVTVMLGGQGGDEIFGGYARYLIAYMEQALKGAIFETQEEGRHIVTLHSIVPNLTLLQDYAPLMQHFFQTELFEPMDRRYFHLIDRSPDIAMLLSDEVRVTFNREHVFAEFQQTFNRPDTLSYINKMTHFDLKTLLPALLQVEDRVSMAVSLESRVPLLDPRIMELMATIPPPLKFSGGRSKYLLKNVARTRIPSTVLNRKDKMGFPVPLKEWLQTEPVKSFVYDTLFSRASRERGLFKPSALEDLIKNEIQFGRQLWGVLCLELWHQQYIDNPNPTSY